MRPASSVVPLRFRHRTSRLALLLATTALTGPGFVSVAAAQNLPTGSSVAAGSASVAQPSSTSLAITQSSQSAVVNWQSFSIGQGYCRQHRPAERLVSAAQPRHRQHAVQHRRVAHR